MAGGESLCKRMRKGRKAVKETARLAMIELTPEEEDQLKADFEQMKRFGQRLAQSGGSDCEESGE